MSDLHLTSSFGHCALRVRHYHPKSALRAWDAADEYVLQYLAELACFKSTENEIADSSGKKLLLVNDACGALACSLRAFDPVSWGDQETGRLTLAENLVRNGQPADAVPFVPGDQVPGGRYDRVVIKLPKTLSLLRWQLSQLAPLLAENAWVVGAGMVKHMSKSMVEAFTEWVGPATTSLAWKKARLIFSQPEGTRFAPEAQPVEYVIPDTSLRLLNYANVFSQHKMDIGTRFLLAHFPDLSKAQSVVDLGCGNGALGVFAASRYPHLKLYFLDDSYLALKSAQASFCVNGLGEGAEFIPSDALCHFPETAVPVDAVLCNPPFHEGNKVHTDIALRMFQQASRILSPEGGLHVIANRHLGYATPLKKWFHSVSVVASNGKFVVIRADYPRQDKTG